MNEFPKLMRRERGGGAYQIHVERDGRGGIAPLAGPVSDGLCRGAGRRRAQIAHTTLMLMSGRLPWQRTLPNLALQGWERSRCAVLGLPDAGRARRGSAGAVGRCLGSRRQSRTLELEGQLDRRTGLRSPVRLARKRRQRGRSSRPLWHRLLTVPADTESVVSDGTLVIDDRFVFRVFAYNDRGYSRASARSGSCRANAETLCLRNSRFQVKVNWWSADGESGFGRVVDDRTDDPGMFRFFGPENWEVLIKVLDGCRTNGRVWVLGASTTDLGYLINVTDTIAQESRRYRNEPGRPAPAIVDTKAFSGACR